MSGPYVIADGSGALVGRVNTDGAFVTIANNTPAGYTAVADPTGAADPAVSYVTGGAITARPALTPGLSGSYSLNATVTPSMSGQPYVVTPPPAGTGGHGGPAGADIALVDGDSLTLDARGTWRIQATGNFPYLDYTGSTNVP